MAGTTSPTIKLVMDTIENARNKLLANQQVRNAQWTDVILSDICKANPDRPKRNCCGRCKEAYGEWLFDLVWYKENHNRQLIELRLVLESEWSHNKYDIKYDFEKLLIAKCDSKVMLTESPDAKQVVQEGIKSFSVNCSSEQYLLANHDGNGAFDFTVFDSRGNSLFNKTIPYQNGH